MSTITPDEFLDLLKRSDLLEDQTYVNALNDIKQEAPNVFINVNDLANEYIKRGLLTPWHVRQLLKRKYKGFYLRQYRILGHLGSGGMSSVYLGEHTVMKRRVAIKVLPKRRLNPTYLDRFAREAQAIASLDSQHVVRAYDVDRFEDVHYIVMEYFEGQNLRQLVEKEGPLDYEDAANYIRQAALGLSDAHKKGIVHRDVKPDNIVVDEKGFVKILDLGLALLDEVAYELQGTIFDEDKILGTADYLAPEQALNSHNVDARADVYGLGATLYFCLVGKPPFPFGSIPERLLAHQRKEPTSIFVERPDAPTDLVDFCSKMMVKKPELRIQTMEEVTDFMRRWLIRHGFAQLSDFTSDDNVDNELPPIELEHKFLADENATDIGFDRAGASFRLSDAELNGFAQNKNEHSVDLYGASESGTSVSRLDASASRVRSRTDNVVLSKKTTLEVSLDPLELALNEIADTTKEKTLPGAPAKVRVSTPSNRQHLSSNAQIINFQQYQRPSEQSDDPKSQEASLGNSRFSSDTPQNQAERQQVGEHVSSGFSERPTQSIASKEASLTNQPESTPFSQTSDKRPDPILGDWYKEVPIWFWTVAIGGYALAIFLAGILFTLLLKLK